MNFKPLKEEVKRYLAEHQLEKKFAKAQAMFVQDIQHPSLNVELLEPKHLRVYSFRVNRRYRAIFIVVGGEAEVLTVTNHYK